MNNLWILAQAETDEAPTTIGPTPVTEEGESVTKQPADANAPPPTQPRRPFGGGQWLFIGLMLVVMYFIIFRGPRKKQQQHKQMVQSLQRNDRVRTIGGIIGTVVDVKDDEITLKIDESNNTKIKVAPSAIGRNLSKDSK
ncbi:MAG: preprotein translocase subunit YajC [Planctomycetota bacterium]|jgi:preprotein translocase subunit YajC